MEARDRQKKEEAAMENKAWELAKAILRADEGAISKAVKGSGVWRKIDTEDWATIRELASQLAA